MSDYPAIRAALDRAGEEIRRELLAAEAERAIEAAKVEIVAAERLLTITTATRWLNLQGVTVHKNTVRNWCKAGRVKSRLREDGYLIPLDALKALAAHMKDCPFCRI